MYAIVEVAGSQHKVEEGQVITVPHLKNEEGDEIILDKVCLVADGDKISVGTPYVDGAKISAKVEKQFRDKTLRVFRFKAKSNYHRTVGHRTQKTKILISGING